MKHSSPFQARSIYLVAGISVPLWAASTLAQTTPAPTTPLTSESQPKATPTPIPTPLASDPIKITGPELKKLNFGRTDGGLPLLEGSKVNVVFRADRENPEKSDGLGWTYHHHPDIAIWKGRIYIGWNSCEKDEDTWPSRELFATSTDGKTWTKPAEMFPQGVSTPLRMYFFRAPNGRMLVIAGLRVSHEPLKEENKGPLVVREIREDHTLGPVYTLRAPETPIAGQMPMYTNSLNNGFVTACQQLLADRIYLEQQDYGVLLPEAERIKWHKLDDWKADEWTLNAAKEWGKSNNFYRRADGKLVAVSKKRWVTLSDDDGKTWSQPVRPTSLITNMGKVWGQQTRDGNYILAYNPHLQFRYPLVLVSSKDGISFNHMRTLHGEIPEIRYPGKFKSRGTSYVRGLSKWTNDGSRPNDPVWLVYSMNKEEIWLSSFPH